MQSKEDILALTAKSSNKEDEVAYSPVVTVKYQSSKLNLRAAAIDLTNEQRYATAGFPTPNCNVAGARTLSTLCNSSTRLTLSATCSRPLV